jgi:Tfp pilus assembly protein PilE
MKTTRRGATMLEMIVASALLGTLLVVTLQLCAATAAQRQAAARRQCASLELANVMERVAARPWSELNTAALAAEHVSPSAGAQLPGAELKIAVVTPAGEPQAKRLTATVRWQDRGRPPQLLRLTTWRYRNGNK